MAAKRKRKTQHEELTTKLGDLEQRLDAIGVMLRQRLAEQQEQERQQRVPVPGIKQYLLHLWHSLKVRAQSYLEEAPATS